MDVTASVPAARYQRFIAGLRRSRSGVVFDNWDGEHAQNVIHDLLTLAAGHARGIWGRGRSTEPMPVFIVSGGLAPIVYDSLVDVVKKVLGQGISVRILTEKSENEMLSNEFYKVVNDATGGVVRTLHTDDIEMTHFTLVGDVAYRIETNKGELSAKCSFHDEAGLVTHILREDFEKAWDRAILHTKELQR